MTRRMTLLVLAVVGLMVGVVTISPPEGTLRRGAEEASTPAPPAPGLSDSDAFDVTAKLSTAPGAKAKTIEAVLGDRVEIVVEGSEPASVALGDLRIEELEQGVPARFELLAETPGAYPLTLIDEDRRIGTLEIR
jgi:hypothetical protein